MYADVIITIGVYSLTGRVVTAATVAAVLTVLGYSLYDTIIVFDRVRENTPLLRKNSFAQIVNVSIWSRPATIDRQKLVLKEIDLRGTIGYVSDHPATIKLVQEGKIDLKPFTTSRIPLDQLIDKGFDTLINHKDTAVKVLVHP